MTPTTANSSDRKALVRHSATAKGVNGPAPVPPGHPAPPRATPPHRHRQPYAGWRVAMLINGVNIEIVTLDGKPLRRLVLDPTTNYQRIP